MDIRHNYLWIPLLKIYFHKLTKREYIRDIWWHSESSCLWYRDHAPVRLHYFKEWREETKGDYQRLVKTYSVERWINYMAENEICKGMIHIAYSWIFSSNMNISGTCICIVCPTCDEEKESSQNIGLALTDMELGYLSQSRRQYQLTNKMVIHYVWRQ